MMELNKLYLMDCIKGMKAFPDKYFDLAIVDPPYGINAEQGTNRASRKQFADKTYGWDKSIPDSAYFAELRRVSRDQIIWGGNYFLEHIGSTRGFIIWDKLNPDRCFADCEFAWNSMDRVARIYKDRRTQELNNEDGGKIHPTQKPIRLYKWILNNYAKPEIEKMKEKRKFRIVDTHVGSASSIIAFLDFGCEWIGFEIDEDYHKAASERIEIHKQQLRADFKY